VDEISILPFLLFFRLSLKIKQNSMSNSDGKKLFLLDAYALIFRAYYAFIRNPRITSKGFNTSAIFGFTNSLLEILEKEKPSHLAVAFDPAGPTFRHHMYKEYKAHREATPEDIRKAVPVIKQMLESMNISIVEVDGYEADDVVGTLAKKAAMDHFETYMVTPDKDYMQLVDENIWMYKPRSKGGGHEIIGVPEVREHFAVESPDQVIDILGLWGDNADNIPGCPGVGEKRAKELIAKYGNIEGIYSHIDELKGKQKENMMAFKDQVEISRKLVIIDTRVPHNYALEDFKMQAPDLDSLYQLMDELEFRTLKARVSQVFNVGGVVTPAQPSGTAVQGDLFANVSSSENGNMLIPTYIKTLDEVIHSYYLVDNEISLLSLLSELSVQKVFCFDTETTSVNSMEAELVGLAFSWESGKAYYVPVPNDPEYARTFMRNFKPVFESEVGLKVGQNLKYDITVLKNYDIDVRGQLFDTMVAHHLLHPGLKNNMDFMAEMHLNYAPRSIETLIGKKGKNQGSMRDVPIEKVKEYAGEDADITFQLYELFELKLKKSEIKDLFYNIEMPLVSVLSQMEFNGVKLDKQALETYAGVLRTQIIDLEKKIYDLAQVAFNIASPRQVGEILFERLKIDEKAKKTKSGQYSTGEEILIKLKSKHDIVPAILEFRGLNKLLNTYVEALPKLIHPDTGKIHTSYNQTVVVTGRLSSTNPNLQNIPIRDASGREIRKAFVASDENRVFLSADYSQVELRLMAHFSEDKHLIEAFNRGEDIHAATAAKIFKVDLNEVDDDMRRKAKTANFGIIYGISAFGLAERLNISRKEAKDIIDGYFESFPGVKKFMDASIAKAREAGYVETLYGRRRYLNDINSRNGVVRGIAERNAINAPIQGTAADIIKVAMNRIHERLHVDNLQSKMILQVHDELNFDVFKPELVKMQELVKQQMERACELSVPLVVDMGVGNNWLQAH
jgi:DNA polymerase-1